MTAGEDPQPQNVQCAAIASAHGGRWNDDGKSDRCEEVRAAVEGVVT